MAAQTEKALANLANRARRLVRRRGAVLPTAEELARFAILCFGREEAERILVDAGGEVLEQEAAAIVEAVAGLLLPPAAEALREAVVSALAAVVGQDAKAYRAACADVERATIALHHARPTWWAALRRETDWAMAGRAEKGEGLLEAAGLTLSLAVAELADPAVVEAVLPAVASEPDPGQEAAIERARAAAPAVVERVLDVIDTLEDPVGDDTEIMVTVRRRDPDEEERKWRPLGEHDLGGLGW